MLRPTALKRASASCCKHHKPPAPSSRRPARVCPAIKSVSPLGTIAEHDLFKVVSAVCDSRPSDDAGLIAQEASLAFHYLRQAGSLPTAWQPVDLVNRAFELTDLLATGSTFRTLQMLKRHPNLLLLSPCQVASKVLQLKLLMPPANVAELVYQKPTLLMLDDIPAVLGPALNKLHMLMPGIPVEKKLHEGGTVFWSFASLLDSSSTTRSSNSSVSSNHSGQHNSRNSDCSSSSRLLQSSSLTATLQTWQP